MSDLELAKPTTALLFSGGLDSFLAWKLYAPADTALVYCATGHRYQDAELAAIKALGLAGRVHVDHALDLASWERADAIVPLRNLLFAAVATRYGDTVWLGALRDEMNADKSPRFMASAAYVMSLAYAPSYWCAGREIKFCSPVAHLTKRQLIAEALGRGMAPEAWAATISCYAPSGKCGACKSCFKRWQAHALCGVVEARQYDAPPWLSAVAVQEREQALAGFYMAERNEEILQAFGAVGA